MNFKIELFDGLAPNTTTILIRNDQDVNNSLNVGTYEDSAANALAGKLSFTFGIVKNNVLVSPCSILDCRN